MSLYPLVLSHIHVRQILERHPTILILTRNVRPDDYEIHNAQTIQRNTRHRKNGRPDLQQDPLVFNIRIEKIHTIPLLELDLKTVRAAGFKTLEDFYLDWLARRHRIHTESQVRICSFRIIEETRYLHIRVHRGYTTDPARAAPGEPQALSRTELDELTKRAAAHRNEHHAEQLVWQQRRSLGIRLKDAAQRQDPEAWESIRAQLLEIAGGTVAGTAIAA